MGQWLTSGCAPSWLRVWIWVTLSSQHWKHPICAPRLRAKRQNHSAETPQRLLSLGIPEALSAALESLGLLEHMRFHKEGADDAVHFTELWKNRKGTQEGPSTLKHVIFTSGNHMGGDKKAPLLGSQRLSQLL